MASRKNCNLTKQSNSPERHDERKMRIALFGGTFDPIHNGHIILAERVRDNCHFDEVWFLVTPQNPWKLNNKLSSDEKRLDMTRKALEGHTGLVASDYEFHLEKPSYSYKTLRQLRQDFPDKEFSLLIGADNWVKFDNWAEHEEILEHHSIYVYPRDGYPFDESTLPESVHFVDTELLNISSTFIRESIRRGNDVKDLVPKAILEDLNIYIDQ